MTEHLQLLEPALPELDVPYTAVSTALTAMRRDACMTQKALAERSGIGMRTISSFERGGPRVGAMKLDQIAALTGACDFTVAEFFEFVDAIKNVKKFRRNR